MPPALTVLQLDTSFPRVAGDVGCSDTYASDVEIIRIPSATVAQVVTDNPEGIAIKPFENALRKASGDIIATSCGFLSYWQNHLAARTPKPFISSSLIALDHMSQSIAPEELLILTFDAERLNAAHLGKHKAYTSSIVGLPKECHLRTVISQNKTHLDTKRASDEILAHVAKHQTPKHRHILLECTNLPPYKAALHRSTNLPITDILTLIEQSRPNIIKPNFLEGHQT
ncbi:hypothetical protein [Planktotalea sp.]|uniref:hypothetical protein n=1 Tax=Planktotalea sp. TaxID=2029877 RepID=UPI003D6C113E